MGCNASKRKDSTSRTNGLEDVQSKAQVIKEDEVLIALREDLRRNPERFLLNNILLSVQFFENYEREIKALKTQGVKKEADFNQKLSKLQKHCVLPDAIFEVVNRKVRFRQWSDQNVQSEPLRPQRLFVVHDNFDVGQEWDSSEYASVDKCQYFAVIEGSDNSGFVKLMHINNKIDESSKKEARFVKNKNGPRAVTFADEEPTRRKSFVAPVKQYSDSSSDTEYGYSTITYASRPRPLNEMPVSSNRHEQSLALPKECFSEVKERVLDTDEDDDDDVDMFIRTKKYFNSKEFALHFIRTFKGELGEGLGFTSSNLTKATYRTSVISCEGDFDNGRFLYEIIPALGTYWPAAALEWKHRRRNKVLDYANRTSYSWPIAKMVSKVESLHISVLPIGFMAKRGTNESYALEWMLAFPKAERYLETCMSHPQMRCYLFLLTLLKTFMDPAEAKNGLTADHIRHCIFWQVEKNFIDWRDDKLGEKLIQVLHILYDSISKGMLMNYFIANRNMLENIPSSTLRHPQRKILDILENPIPHILFALRNLRYTQGTFYPVLNFNKLFEILTTKDDFGLVNPQLSSTLIDSMEISDDDDDFKENKIAFWDLQKKHDNERLWAKKRYNQIKQEKLEKQKNLKKEERGRRVADVIKLNVNIPRDISHLKRRAIIEFFLDHFLLMASRSIALSVPSMCTMYTKHCQHLSQLLSEEPSGEVESREYNIKIAEVKERMNNLRLPPGVTRQFSSSKERSLIVAKGTDMRSLNISRLDKEYRAGQAENIVTAVSTKKVRVQVHQPEYKTQTSGLSLESNDSGRESTDL